MLKHRPDGPSSDLPQSPARKKPRLSDESETRRPSTTLKPRSQSLNISSQSSAEARARRQRAIEMALKGMSDPQSSKPIVTKAPDTSFDSAPPPPEVVPSSQDSEMSDAEHDTSKPLELSTTTVPIRSVEADLATRSPFTDTPSKPSTSFLADDEPQEDDPSSTSEISTWFEPSASQASFLPASQLPEVSKTMKVHKPTSWVMPSQSALEIAARRVEQWQQEPDAAEEPPVEESVSTPTRKPLGVIGNLGTNTPGPIASLSPKLAGQKSFKPPLRVGGDSSNPFASPQLPRSRLSSFSKPVFQSSPLNPNAASQRAGSAHPPQSPGFSTPARGGLGMLARARPGNALPRPSFTTPFKANMKPGEPGRLEAEKEKERKKLEAAERAERERLEQERKTKERNGAVFNLSPPAQRQSMREAGVVPQSFTLDELIHFGVPPELANINIWNAPYYRFHAPTASQLIGDKPMLNPLGVDSALLYLRKRGCKLINAEWVRNHWSFVLWKLATLVCACPDLAESKWSYEEATKQLLYRYEREVNQAHRPPIRLITEGDTSSARPMVLCVCGIAPGEDTVTENGEVIEGLPTLDVTDGWYKLRATVDVALARAVKRGLIKSGTKLAMSGAKFQGGKEGIEPLQAYEKTCLELHGNSTTLARWDAKLGFQAKPFICTLRSLTVDGGPVPLMDIQVTKLFPVAYIEMPRPSEEAEGEEPPRPIPRCEAEEREARDQWQQKRVNEELRLREEWEKKVSRLEGLAENLERTAGRWVLPEDDYPPDEVEDLLEELDDADDLGSLVKGLSPTNAGWLAHLIRKKCLDMKDRIGETIQRELEARTEIMPAPRGAELQSDSV
ncbi:hypothetical protein FRC04_009403 [Tulasnella sp. 424]|nr:hypothetical protein FRC04_009403 [Tulasnella sp. 424]